MHGRRVGVAYVGHQHTGVRATARGGSSPRARGKPPSSRARRCAGRFIPACAGNTCSRTTRTTSTAVHPRVRGEHANGNRNGKHPAGSFPRARGTPNSASSAATKARFIPACAGNTIRPNGQRSCRAVPFPRARGTPKKRGRTTLYVRFIPACAGNTRGTRDACRASSVHPRVRGEHLDAMGTHGDVLGSSPRARGTPGHRLLVLAAKRFIPACAGNTTGAPRRRHHASVHPRVRGEHKSDPRVVRTVDGSSPRARGTPGTLTLWGWNYRFIPACAGNTPGLLLPLFVMWVHPRVRGEHCESVTKGALRIGSSPRARGTQVPLLPRGRRRRFIPACAGNTKSSASSGSRSAVHPRVRG